MRAAPVVRAAAGGVARRRVQTMVIGLVLGISSCAAVLAIALVVDSSGPFDKAFAAQRGADVTAAIDAARATPAQLAATARLPQVTAAAGPFPVAAVRAMMPAGPKGGVTPPFTEMLTGRASPGGPVDDLTLRAGHWPRRDGQIVLGGTWPSVEFISLGSTITVTGVPGTPVLIVVGIGTSVTQSADGWVLPGEIARLAAPGAPASAQMLYRFRSAGTDAAIRGDVAAVTRALPVGAVTGTQSYLAVRSQEQSSIALYLPFLIAFGVIGLVMSLLIVASVVSGAVVAGYGRIGVLKSIGLTPRQVVAAYTIQAMVPAAAGCLAGAVLGVVVAGRLLLNTAATAFGVGTLGGLPAWAAVGAPAAMCALTGIAAVAPALRAGRFSAVEAIAAGRAPRTGRGYAPHRLLGRLALPRPVTIGLAAPFARPARTAVMLAVVLLGAATVTFGAGLSTSLVRIANGVSLVQTWQDVLSSAPAGNPRRAQAGRRAPQQLTARQQAIAEAAIRAQPGTLHYVAVAQVQASVAGLAQQVPVTAYRGDASWIGYPMVSGHWYTGPGQADVPLGFLTATGTKVGDTVTITVASRRIPVRIVGDVFDTDNNGLTMLTGFQTLADADPSLAPGLYAIGVRPGTSPFVYQLEMSRGLPDGFSTGMRDTHGSPLPYMIILTGTLVVLLAVAASLGVANTVVLHTRERVHDLGVFKAVGMTPRQAAAMVVCWVAGTGLAAGMIAVAAGITLHRYMIPRLAVFAGNGMPPSFLDVYSGWEVAGLALAGLVIAVAGALLPAGWAAGVPAASALRAE
jgi:putative ABC transport system permease protein